MPYSVINEYFGFEKFIWYGDPSWFVLNGRAIYFSKSYLGFPIISEHSKKNIYIYLL